MPVDPRLVRLTGGWYVNVAATGRFTEATIQRPRKTSLEVHAHLRRLIIDSVLPPNTVLKQTEVATAFAVSRTPVREAIRMLQEEGLIEADLNQRGRVRGMDPDELDQPYAARITLESLGTRISTGLLGLGEAARAQSWLDTMASAETDTDVETWLTAHRHFHVVYGSGRGTVGPHD